MDMVQWLSEPVHVLRTDLVILASATAAFAGLIGFCIGKWWYRHSYDFRIEAYEYYRYQRQFGRPTE